MATSFLRKALNIINPFDENTISSSFNAKGGLLGGVNIDPSQLSANQRANVGLPVSYGFGPNQTPDGVSQAVASLPSPAPTASPNRTPYGPSRPAAPQTNNATNRPVSTQRQAAPAVGAPAPVQPPMPRNSLGFFNGREYFDPSELYNDQLSYLDSLYGTNLSQMRQGKERQLGEYGRQKETLGNQLNEILAGYATQQEQGLGNIGNYYSNLGDIYQSSQNTRETDLRGEVEKARGKATTQAQEGQSAIERAIAEYLGNFDQSERQLATQYQGARDEIGSGLVGDLNNRLGVQDITASGIQTDLTPDEINTNNALITSLQRLRGNRFNNPFQQTGGQINTNPILQYLQGLL